MRLPWHRVPGAAGYPSRSSPQIPPSNSPTSQGVATLTGRRPKGRPALRMPRASLGPLLRRQSLPTAARNGRACCAEPERADSRQEAATVQRQPQTRAQAEMASTAHSLASSRTRGRRHMPGGSVATTVVAAAAILPGEDFAGGHDRPSRLVRAVEPEQPGRGLEECVAQLAAAAANARTKAR